MLTVYVSAIDLIIYLVLVIWAIWLYTKAQARSMRLLFLSVAILAGLELGIRSYATMYPTYAHVRGHPAMIALNWFVAIIVVVGIIKAPRQGRKSN